MNAPELKAIPDVQATEDKRHLAIDQVGIKAIRHPVKVKERDGGIQHTIATFNMYVGLPHHFKGTHMSRFVSGYVRLVRAWSWRWGWRRSRRTPRIGFCERERG